MSSPFITLAEMKEYLGITTIEHDLKLQSGVDSISSYIEEYTGVVADEFPTQNNPQLRNVAFKLVEIDFYSIGGKYIAENGSVYDISHSGMPKNLREVLDRFARKNVTNETDVETVFTL